jgi:hypothetical protein
MHVHAPPQVVRRLFALAGTAALVAAGEGSGGLDVALGPNCGSMPLGALGPSAVLQGLLSGPPSPDPRLSTAALPLVRPRMRTLPLLLCILGMPSHSLPRAVRSHCMCTLAQTWLHAVFLVLFSHKKGVHMQGACATAPHAILARQDGTVLAAAARQLQDPGGALDAAAADALTRTLRRALLQLTLVKGPREPGGKQSSGAALCFCGDAAAAAARSGRPLDLLGVAARLDAGAT